MENILVATDGLCQKCENLATGINVQRTNYFSNVMAMISKVNKE